MSVTSKFTTLKLKKQVSIKNLKKKSIQMDTNNITKKFNTKLTKHNNILSKSNMLKNFNKTYNKHQNYKKINKYSNNLLKTNKKNIFNTRKQKNIKVRIKPFNKNFKMNSFYSFSISIGTILDSYLNYKKKFSKIKQFTNIYTFKKFNFHLNSNGSFSLKANLLINYWKKINLIKKHQLNQTKFNTRFISDTEFKKSFLLTKKKDWFLKKKNYSIYMLRQLKLKQIYLLLKHVTVLYKKNNYVFYNQFKIIDKIFNFCENNDFTIKQLIRYYIKKSRLKLKKKYKRWTFGRVKLNKLKQFLVIVGKYFVSQGYINYKSKLNSLVINGPKSVTKLANQYKAYNIKSVSNLHKSLIGKYVYVKFGIVNTYLNLKSVTRYKQYVLQNTVRLASKNLKRFRHVFNHSLNYYRLLNFKLLFIGFNVNWNKVYTDYFNFFKIEFIDYKSYKSNFNVNNLGLNKANLKYNHSMSLFLMYIAKITLDLKLVRKYLKTALILLTYNLYKFSHYIIFCHYKIYENQQWNLSLIKNILF